MDIQQAAQQALAVQDACNLSGVVFSFAEVMEAICEEQQRLGQSTEWKNTHPIVTLFSIQVTPSPQCQSDAVVAAVPTRPVVLRALTTEQLAEEVIQAIQRMSPAEKAKVRRQFRRQFQPSARTRQCPEVVQ